MRTNRSNVAPLSVAALTALALAVSACDAGPAAPDMDMDELGALFSQAGAPPSRGVTVADRGPAGGGVSVFDVLNAQIDGFAGLYRTGMCSIALMLAGDVDADAAVRTAAAVIDPLVGRSCPSGVDVTPQRADYDWNELHRFLTIAWPLAGSPGVFGISLDIPLNGLVIIVDSSDTARRVGSSLGDQSVPVGALNFRIRGTGGTSR